MTHPDVTVILVNYATPELTRQCIESIAAHAHGDFECLVADNSPEQGAGPSFEALDPRVRCLAAKENLGFGRGCNLAAAQARGEFLCLLNTDAQLMEDSLGVLAEHLRGHEDAMAVGCRIVDHHGAVQPSAARFPTLLRVMAGRDVAANKLRRRFPRLAGRVAYFHAQEELAEPRAVDWCIGAAFMVRRAAFEALGGFDPRIFLYGEEMDLCRRIHDQGWEVHYTPATTVRHLRAASSGGRDSASRLAAVAAGQRYFFRKHHGPWKAALFCAAEITASALKACIWGAAMLVSRGPKRAARKDKARWHLRYLGHYFARSY